MDEAIHSIRPKQSSGVGDKPRGGGGLNVKGQSEKYPHCARLLVNASTTVIMSIYHIAIDAKIDMAGITRSVTDIEQLIEREITRGISPNNIILAG